MADGTKIEWTDATANYVNGCSVVSKGCTNCYAMRLAGTRLKDHPSRSGLTMATKAGPVWTGEVRANDRVLNEVMAWKRPRRIFWNAHGDLFHENVPDEWIDRQFAVMAYTPQHSHQVLTKRPERMAAYLTGAGVRQRIADAAFGLFGSSGKDGERRFPPADWPPVWPLPNVWLGTSVEDQAAADARIPHLLATPAAVRFLSCEPLLGPVDLRWAVGHRLGIAAGFLERGRFSPGMETLRPIDWVIVGGESGPGSRPMHPAWAVGLREQCDEAGVPFLFKQWGDWHPADSADHPISCLTDSVMEFRQDGSTDRTYQANYWSTRPGSQGMCRVGKKAAGRLLDGVQHDGMPA